MGTTQVSSAGSREEWGGCSLCKACRSPCLAVAGWVQGQPGVSRGFNTLSPPCCDVRSTLLSTQRSACWERGATVTKKEPRTPSLGNWRGGPPPSCPAPVKTPNTLAARLSRRWGSASPHSGERRLTNPEGEFALESGKPEQLRGFRRVSQTKWLDSLLALPLEC